MDRDTVLIFHSIHRVMRAEKLLKQAGLDVRLVPVPRQLSSDCGLSLAIHGRDRQAADAVLVREGCRPEEVFAREGDRYRRQD